MKQKNIWEILKCEILASIKCYQELKVQFRKQYKCLTIPVGYRRSRAIATHRITYPKAGL